MLCRGDGDFPYREAAGCDSLDVRILGLGAGLDKVLVDEDSADKILLQC